MTPRLSVRTRWTVALAVALSIGAMIRYPGGTALDPTTVGYTFDQNFLSDLGMTVAYDKRPNRLGATFFALSLVLLVVGLGHAVARIARRLVYHPAPRGWAVAAILPGVFASVAFAGVAITPENQVMAMHTAFTVWAWRILPMVAVLLAVASFRAPDLPARVGTAWLLMAILLMAYAALLGWGPPVTTPHGIVVQVVAQKVAAVVAVATLLFVSQEVDRAATAHAR